MKENQWFYRLKCAKGAAFQHLVLSLSVRVVVNNWFVCGTFPARIGDGLYDSYMRIDECRYPEPTNEERSPSGLPCLSRPHVSILKSSVSSHCVAVRTIQGSNTSLRRINFKSGILQLCSGFLISLFFLNIKRMCCIHCRTCWQPQESHLTALSSCFNQKKLLYKGLKRSAVSPCTLISESTHALLCLLLHVSILVSLMKIPTDKYIGAAEGAVWVCVAAKRLTKVSFCSENLGIICHFFCYRNSSLWTEGVARLFHQGSVPSADVELGDFFFL